MKSKDRDNDKKLSKEIEFYDKYDIGCGRFTTYLERDLYVERKFDVFKSTLEIEKQLKNRRGDKKTIEDLFSYITAKPMPLILSDGITLPGNLNEKCDYILFYEFRGSEFNSKLTLRASKYSIKRRRNALLAMLRTTYLKEEILKNSKKIKQTLKDYNLITEMKEYH